MAGESDEMMALISVRNLHRHLVSGVTTIRDNGSRNRVTFVVREALRRGYFVGPPLLLAGRPLTHRLGHFHWSNLPRPNAALNCLVPCWPDRMIMPSLLAAWAQQALKPEELADDTSDRQISVEPPDVEIGEARC
jgi:hypothetical protein